MMKVQYGREQGSYGVKEGHLSFCTRTLGWGMIAGFGSDLGCSTFQKRRKRGKCFFFSRRHSLPRWICSFEAVWIAVSGVRLHKCCCLVFTILVLKQQHAHGLPEAMQHAASCPEGFFGGYGVHTSTSPTVEIALGNGPDEAL